MRVIKNLDLSKTIIIDNSPIAFATQMTNGICIPSYLGQDNDDELNKIADFLIKIVGINDVRPFVSKFTGIPELYKQLSIK